MDKNKKNTIKYIIGIDEVGRGPIAGPVAVGAFLLSNDYFWKEVKEANLPELRDSKKLTKKQRIKWFSFLKKMKSEELCNYTVSFVSPEMIDKFGISKSIKKALEKSLQKLELKKDQAKIFLDGGLKAPNEFKYQETVIKGDEIHPIVSLASIVAKVLRDRVMANLSKDYPEYGFENHVGYGTRAHYEAIKKHGLCPIHRRSFIH